jgi:hypothetical protein
VLQQRGWILQKRQYKGVLLQRRNNRESQQQQTRGLVQLLKGVFSLRRRARRLDDMFMGTVTHAVYKFLELAAHCDRLCKERREATAAVTIDFYI